jgi:hypothetical protein
VIKSIYFPGPQHGKDIYTEIDTAYQKMDWKHLPISRKFLAAAYFLTFLSSTHALPDGNGRVSVAIAKLIIDRHTPMKLNLETLNMFNTDLMNYMAVCSVRMFPDKENPTNFFQSHIQGNYLLDLSEYNTIESLDFIHRYYRNIVKTIRTVGDNRVPENIDLVEAEQSLAFLLAACSE